MRNARIEFAVLVRKAVGDEKVAARVMDAEPGPALVRLLKERLVDLLVMGPHGRGVVR